MRLATITASIIALTLCLGSSAYATQVEFYPPERINCKLIGGDQFKCEGFDRQVLIEESTNADLQKGIEDTFYFVYALAYLTPDQSATVFFNYNDTKFKLVRLRTMSTIFHPDVSHGSWKKYEEGIYVCDESYMACSLTTAFKLSHQ